VGTVEHLQLGDSAALTHPSGKLLPATAEVRDLLVLLQAGAALDVVKDICGVID
jgi:hypothetical protein